MAQSDFSPKKPDGQEHDNIASGRDDRSNRSSGSIIPTKLYVKRIPETVTSEELHDLFSQFGSVTECAIIRSYAFIHFSTPEEATRAVNELNGFRFMGIILEIEHSKSQSKGRRLSNRRDIYRMEENRGGMGMGMGMGRRERDRSPAYTGAYRADPYSPEAGYGGGYEYGQGGYGGYSEGYGGYMGHPYRSPAPRRGGFGPSGPRYPPPHPGPPPPPQQYSNYPPHSPTGYQTYGPPRPRPPPPPPTGYYPPS